MPTKLECPQCSVGSDIFTVHGTLVTGEMSVRIGQNGIVQSAGPIRPKTLIKPGQELKGRFSLTCPNCGYSGRPDTYRSIMTSILSGKPAYKTIQCSTVRVAVADGEEDEAALLFTEAAFSSWNDLERVAAVLG